VSTALGPPVHDGQTPDVPGVRPGPAATAGIVLAYLTVFFGLLPILLWSLGYALDDALALPVADGPGWPAAGLALTTLGLLWMVWAMVLLRVIGGGWPISHLPPVRLVTTGPYRFSRHPVYAGYLAVAAGLALVNRSPGQLLAAGLLAVGIVDYVLGVEGPGLRRRFAGYPGYRPGGRRAGRLVYPLWTALRGPVEWLANRPVLFRAAGTVWVTYGLFVALGAAAASSLLLGRLATDGLGAGQLVGYALVVAPTMALGGRLLWFAVEREQVRRMGVWRAVRTVGLVSWGTYLGFIAGCAVYAAVWHVGLLWLLDRTVPTVLVCSVIGRIGCLSYGCCFGRPWPPGVRWYAPDSKVVRQLGPGAVTGRVPVQLLSAAATLAAVLVAALVSLRPAPPGVVTGVVMLLYAMGRFAVDAYRDETFALPWAGGLNLGQVCGLVVVAAALALIYGARGAGAWPRSLFSYDWPLLVPLLPLIGAVTALTFVATGCHWRRVGQW
jgi:phosphatidylglycerol---prolipoprotein diacylglyceryl transferase